MPLLPSWFKPEQWIQRDIYTPTFTDEEKENINKLQSLKTQNAQKKLMYEGTKKEESKLTPSWFDSANNAVSKDSVLNFVNSVEEKRKAAQKSLFGTPSTPKMLTDEQKEMYKNNQLRAWIDRGSTVGSNLLTGANNELPEVDNTFARVSTDILGNIAGFMSPNAGLNGQSWSGVLNKLSAPVEKLVASKLPQKLPALAQKLLPRFIAEGTEDATLTAFQGLTNNKPGKELAKDVALNFLSGGVGGALLSIPGTLKSVKADDTYKSLRNNAEIEAKQLLKNYGDAKLEANVLLKNEKLKGAADEAKKLINEYKTNTPIDKLYKKGTTIEFNNTLDFTGKQRQSGKILDYALNESGETVAVVKTKNGVKNVSVNDNISVTKLQPVKPIEPKLQPPKAEDIGLKSYMDEAAIALEKPRIADVPGTVRPKLEVVQPNAASTPIPEGAKERGFSENIRTDNYMDSDIRKNFDEDKLFYEQLANKTTLEKAQTIFDKGYDFAKVHFYKNINNFDASDVPLSRLIANEAAKRGDIQTARDVLSTAAEKLTQAGQFSQAARILRDSDPGTFLTFIQKQINKLNTDGAKKYGKKWTGIELTDDDIQRIGSMQNIDEAGKDSVMEELYNRIVKQIPSTKMEKFDAWRRMAMLLNPKTHLRNVTGNVIMMAMRKTSDTVGAGLEKLTGVKERTKSFMWSRNKDVVNLVDADWETSKNDLLGNGRFDIESLNFMNKDKPIFNKGLVTKGIEKLTGNTYDKGILEAINQFSKNTLNAGDVPFLRRAYKDALGQYVNANNLREVTDQAREYAKRRAYEATFKQANMLSNFITKAKQTTAGPLVEAAIPFSRTPSNIAVSAFEYSPAGILKTLFTAKGSSPAKVIEDLSKGMTGTAIAGLGYLLASWGWGRSEKNNSKNAEAIMQQMGEQPYSITTPIGSYTFDFAQPFAVPLAMGMTLYEGLNKKDELDIEGVTDAIAQGGDTIFNMSMLKNLKDLLGGGFGSATEKIMGLPVSYIEQAFPAIFGQVARSVDDVKRSTYDPNMLIGFGKEIAAKTPYLSKKLEPKLDVFGNEQKQGGSVQQFLSPGYAKGKSEDPVTNEVARLYNSTKETSMLPKVAPYKVDVNGKPIEFTAEEVTELQKVMGKKNFSDIGTLINNPKYRNSSDTDKAKLMKKIVDDNYDYAKEQILKRRGLKPVEKTIIIKGKSYK